MRRHLGALAISATCLLGLVAAGAGSAAADACPNASIRELQGAENLADCRAYEMVSPRDKGGNDLLTTETVQSSADGSRVLFAAPTGFAGSPSANVKTYYLGTRSGDQWSSESVEPPFMNPSYQIFTISRGSSDDLRYSLQASNLPLVTGALSGEEGVYIRDNLTGQRRLVASGPSPLFAEFAGANRVYGGATPDFSHGLFQSRIKLTADAPDHVWSVYEWSPAGLKLASVLPDGTTDPLGSTAITDSLTQGGGGPISADGSKVVFKGETTQGLYLRSGGTTIPISASQRSGDDPTVALPATFLSMAPDGSSITFRGTGALTEDSGGGNELYRYDVATGHLSDLTPPPNPGDIVFVTRVLSVTKNGDDMYFVSLGPALAPGATDGGPNLYHWTSTGGIEFLAELDPAIEGNGPQTWAMSPSGRYLAISSFAKITGFDNSNPSCEATNFGNNPPGVCSEVFVFDTAADTVKCTSCVPGVKPSGHSLVGFITNTANTPTSNYYGRRMLDDGTVFFESANPLVPTDSNGRTDVYQYDATGTSLISSGRGGGDALFADATPDGHTVYFLTSQPLVAQDTDQAIDLYAARVDGGLEAQNQLPDPSACQGDGCQGLPPSPPPGLRFGSADLLDRGNAATGKRKSGASKFSVSAKKQVKGPVWTVRVQAPGRGTVEVSGPRLQTKRRSVGKSGSVALRTHLTRGAQGALRRGSSVRTRVRVAYVPVNGKPTSRTISVLFRSR